MKYSKRRFVAHVESLDSRCLLSTMFAVKDLGPAIYPLGYIDSGGNINSSGQIIATSPEGTRPILSGPNGGQFTFLMDSMAIGISVNDSGMVTGAYRNGSTGPYRTFKYDPRFGGFDIGLPSGTDSKGLGINNSGNIVGAISGDSNTSAHAFLYDGTFHDLRTLGGTASSTSVAYAINNSNQIAGWTNTQTSHSTGDGAHLAFFYSNGVMHSLGSLGNDIWNPDGFSEAFGINNLGQVVGDSMMGTNLPYHGFISDPNGGALHDLGTIPEAVIPYLFSVNDKGESVGYAGMIDGSSHGIYSDGHTMTDLNNMIAQGSGFFIVSAHGINNSDQISAVGVDSSGKTHSLLLTPAPTVSYANHALTITSNQDSGANVLVGIDPTNGNVFVIADGSVTEYAAGSVGVVTFNGSAHGHDMFSNQINTVTLVNSTAGDNVFSNASGLTIYYLIGDNNTIVNNGGFDVDYLSGNSNKIINNNGVSVVRGYNNTDIEVGSGPFTNF